MKKLLLTLTMAGMLTSLQLKAGNAWLFDYDQDAISSELAELSMLENFVSEHAGVTLGMLQSDNELTAGLGFNAADVLNSLQALEPPLGIPSFLWGFCLGWVGILITYLVSDDKEETKKALLGCVIGAVSWVLIDFVFWVAILGHGFFPW